VATLKVDAPEVVDGSWYLRDRSSFSSEDLDLLHDVELLGRSLVGAVERKLAEHRLEWKNVIIVGFGKGAGIATYASLLGSFPKQVSAMILFSPMVPFAPFLAEKLPDIKSISGQNATQAMKVFCVWGSKNRSTPGAYRQLLAQVLKQAPGVHCTPDTLPDVDHAFDERSSQVLASLLPMVLPH
jgi:predicted esterase